MNLASIIEDHPAAAPAVAGQDRSLTYGELRAEVAALRGGLARAGLHPGERVALLLPNDWPFVVAYLAVLGVGAVAVPLDPDQPPPALAAEVAAVGARAAVVAAEAAQAFAHPEGPSPELVVAAPGAEGLPGARSWAEVGGGPPTAMVGRESPDPAVLVFTAGTAGSPKAAILTHGSLLANLDQVQHHPGRALVPVDVSYGVLPMYHVFGVNVVLGLSLRAGASVVMASHFHPDQALRQIPEHRISVLAGAPPMFAALAAAGAPRSEALATVRLAVSGASALSPEVCGAFEETFSIPLWQGYGLTEASPVVTSSVVGGLSKPGSVGVPIPGVEVRLVDEEGQDALVGDAGELWVRGPNVFAGYWEDPEASAAVLNPEGWLKTGDVGVADEDGYLYLVDRSKDLIIVSGFNLYPAEVEETLTALPEVAEAAVVGVPDARTGEAVHAYVVAAPGYRLTEEALDAHCRAHLARYKCPTGFTVVDSLPHGLGGKLLRRALRQQV